MSDFESDLMRIDKDMKVVNDLVNSRGWEVVRGRMEKSRNTVVGMGNVEVPSSCVAAVAGFNNINADMDMPSTIIKELERERARLIKEMEKVQKGIPGRL